MSTHKIPVSICLGDFYLVGKLNVEDFSVTETKRGYNISFEIDKNDIKRIDDEELVVTRNESMSNVIQINFETGEKKWI
jgi:hypothetical protein